MKKILGLVVTIGMLVMNVHATDNISIPNTFSSGETISSSKMNENFSELVQKINELTSRLSDGSGGSSDGSDNSSNFAMIHTKLENAPDTYATVGNLQFRYNSTETGGYIEARTLTSWYNMQVYATLKQTSSSTGETTSSKHYQYSGGFSEGTWNPLIKLWENDDWVGRVPIGGYEPFEGIMFPMGLGDAPPEQTISYRFFANIDGYNQVFIKVEYYE